MVKSWNHENVASAMQDGLWATQVKNEQILTDAYNTARHVILLFSVNKSTAFQGYVSHCPEQSIEFYSHPLMAFSPRLSWHLRQTQAFPSLHSVPN
jgi:hypothetical protein